MSFSIKKTLAAIDKRADPRHALEREEMRKALAPHIDPTSLDNRLARAQMNERAVLEQIEMLRGEKNSELKRTRLDQAFTRLGELYAEQGKYEEAIEVTKDADRRARYRETLKAIERPDDATCNCEPEVGMHLVVAREGEPAKLKEVRIQPRIASKTIVSEKHGGLVTVERCVQCGWKNAR